MLSDFRFSFSFKRIKNYIYSLKKIYIKFLSHAFPPIPASLAVEFSIGSLRDEGFKGTPLVEQSISWSRGKLEFTIHFGGFGLFSSVASTLFQQFGAIVSPIHSPSPRLGARKQFFNWCRQDNRLGLGMRKKRGGGMAEISCYIKKVGMSSFYFYFLGS